jgi:hypothetical protein
MSRNETTPGGCLLGCLLIAASLFGTAVVIGFGLKVGLGL